MAEKTLIAWTHHTFNPWRGCTKVSTGCANCYADTLASRNPKVLGIWGPRGTRVVAAEEQWKQPLKWQKAAKAAGERHRVFCASLADIFEDWEGDMSNAQGVRLFTDRIETNWWIAEQAAYSFMGVRPLKMADVRDRLFKLIDATPDLDWLVLTKRPENIARLMPAVPEIGSNYEVKGPRGMLNLEVRRHNVWLGTSVENQELADQRIPELVEVPAVVHFLSAEPLLGPINLHYWLEIAKRKDTGEYVRSEWRPSIDWVIVGGESGPGYRTMETEWATSLRDQCEAAGVAFFYKQSSAPRTEMGIELEGKIIRNYPTPSRQDQPSTKA